MEIVQKTYIFLGEAPVGLLLSRHASRVNKPRIYLILLIFQGVRLAAYLYWECPERAEIYQNLFKIKQNLDVRLTAYLYLGRLAARNSSKIKFKIIRAAR